MMNGKWKGWGVSERGPYHIKNSIPNQDFFLFKKFSWGAVGVVCDGLGSKRYSHIGSKHLCEAVVESVKIFDFNKDLSLFNDILKSVWKMRIYPLKENDALSTVLFAVIKSGKIYVANSGDGGIVILGEKNIVLNDDGGFSNITSPFGYKELNWRVYDENKTDSVLLCTDGVYDDLKKEKIVDFAKNYINYYKNLSPLKRVKDIKNMLKKWPVKGHSDDKTILALYKDRDEN